MREIVNFPARCRSCGRDSMVPFSRIELLEKFENREPIELVCLHDQQSWIASEVERANAICLLADALAPS